MGGRSTPNTCWLAHVAPGRGSCLLITVCVFWKSPLLELPDNVFQGSPEIHLPSWKRSLEGWGWCFPFLVYFPTINTLQGGNLRNQRVNEKASYYLFPIILICERVQIQNQKSLYAWQITLYFPLVRVPQRKNYITFNNIFSHKNWQDFRFSQDGLLCVLCLTTYSMYRFSLYTWFIF